MENKIKQLRDYVVRSVLITPARREDLLNSLPALSREQITRLIATFQKADNDQHALIVDLLAKQPEVWENITQTIKSGQRSSLRGKEETDRKEEEGVLSSLEDELNSILN